MREGLGRLRRRGFAPRLALDVGAYTGAWMRGFKEVFPECRVIGFEPQVDMRKYWQGLEVYPFLLSDGASTVPFHVMEGDPEFVCKSGASVYREKSYHYEDVEPRLYPTVRLDSWWKSYVSFSSVPGLPSVPDFLKLDVQGSERLVLEGAGDLLGLIPLILMEVSHFEFNEGAPLFEEMMEYMVSRGYVLDDYFEINYLNDKLFQSDVLFRRRDYGF